MHTVEQAQTHTYMHARMHMHTHTHTHMHTHTQYHHNTTTLHWWWYHNHINTLCKHGYVITAVCRYLYVAECACDVLYSVLVQDAIDPRDVSLSLVQAISDNVADPQETSQLYVRSERYLCGHKDHLSLRGVLVKPYDFLAAKNRDVLSEWLTGGARHIVVSKRQINIKEGFCGIALTTLEDPVCTKKAAGRG